MIYMRPLKAAGLSFNFGNVTTSSDVSLPDVCFNIISDLWWFDSIFLSLACFSPGISDGQQNHGFDR